MNPFVLYFPGFITAPLITFLYSTIKLASSLGKSTLKFREETHQVTRKIPACALPSSELAPNLRLDPVLYLILDPNNSLAEKVCMLLDHNLQMSLYLYLHLCWPLFISLCEGHNFIKPPVHILPNLYFLFSHWATLWEKYVYNVCTDVLLHCLCYPVTCRLLISPTWSYLSHVCFIYIYIYIYNKWLLSFDRHKYVSGTKKVAIKYLYNVQFFSSSYIWWNQVLG